MPPKSSRRDFLRGKAAAEVIQNVAAELSDHAGDTFGGLTFGASDRESAGYLLRFGRRAMACEFEILLNAGQYAIGPETALAALDLVDELESQLTVFRDDSEVSRINQAAYLRIVEVESKLFALLELAAQINRETDGAYDITSGPLTKAWGFFRRAGKVPTNADLDDARRCVGMQHLEFDPQNSTIRFRKPGIEINLGSIGKGYALDRVSELLMTAGIENFLLHGGNSSVLGRGGNGTSAGRDDTANLASPRLRRGADAAVDDPLVPHPPAEPGASGPARIGGWWIGLRHPLAPERRIGEILLRDRALGTSGSGTQFFTHEGRRYGHILDPRTGRPAEGMLSVTVAAPNGAQADALATAFYVMGVDAAIEYCRRRTEIAAVMMSPVADNGNVDVTLFGFAEGEIRLYDDPSLSVRRPQG
jgi:FAD:protein FMN transferase